jgi:predicted DNA-binding transcriptional regulator AlpA
LKWHPAHHCCTRDSQGSLLKASLWQPNRWVCTTQAQACAKLTACRWSTDGGGDGEAEHPRAVRLSVGFVAWPLASVLERASNRTSCTASNSLVCTRGCLGKTARVHKRLSWEDRSCVDRQPLVAADQQLASCTRRPAKPSNDRQESRCRWPRCCRGSTHRGCKIGCRSQPASLPTRAP